MLNPVDHEGVHLTHCCPVHGCKYAYDDEQAEKCPVYGKNNPPAGKNNNGCEQCEYDEEVFRDFVEAYGKEEILRRLSAL